MIWYIPLGAVALYGSLACATIKPVPVVTPTGSKVTTPQPLPAKPDLPAICKQLNEMGVQTYPSLNPN